MERNLIFVGSFVLIAFLIIALESRSCDERLSLDALITSIHSPSDESMEAVVALGTDSRYYSVVCGWARYELSGVESQISVLSENVNYDELLKKELFLREVIRRIDLE